MKYSKRNIPDPISPQNPLNKTAITNDRIQEHLEEKTSVEDILKEDIFKDENELTSYGEQEVNRGQPRQSQSPDQISPEEEAGI